MANFKESVCDICERKHSCKRTAAEFSTELCPKQKDFQENKGR